VLERISIVLVRPRRGGNVGAVARAMKNMGLGDLVLVAPRTRTGRMAERMAAHARDVLARRRTVATLAEAVADAELVIAASARSDGRSDGAGTPREVAREAVAAAARSRVAVVFGPEDHGLANSELDLCHRLVCIPTAGAYSSLNLAQAVLVVAYEVLLAAGPAPPPRPRTGRDLRRAEEHRNATSGEREAMIEHLATGLAEIGFLSPSNPQPLRDLRSLFARAGLTRRDVRVWRGIARQVRWAAGRAAKAGSGAVTSAGAARGSSPDRRRSR
jgi:TrmH family RNA methyltransferase